MNVREVVRESRRPVVSVPQVSKSDDLGLSPSVASYAVRRVIQPAICGPNIRQYSGPVTASVIDKDNSWQLTKCVSHGTCVEISQCLEYQSIFSKLAVDCISTARSNHFHEHAFSKQRVVGLLGRRRKNKNGNLSEHTEMSRVICFAILLTTAPN